MSSFLPSSYKRIDYGDMLLKGLLLFPIFFWLMFTATIYLGGAEGQFNGQPIALTDIETKSLWTCIGHLPLQLTDEAKACTSLVQDIGVEPAINRYFSISTLVALLGASIICFSTVTRRDKQIHVRGIERLDGKQAHDFLKQHTAREAHKDKNALDILPYMSISSQRQGSHVGVLGGTGSGKTQVILAYLMLLLRMKHKLVIHDVKGDFTSWIKGAILLAPADARSSIWDIGRDVYSRPTIVDFAAHLVPSPEGAKDPFWSNAARMMLIGYLSKLCKEKPREWGWVDLAGVAQMQTDDWEDVLTEYAPEALEYIQNKDSNLAIGVQADLKSHFGLVADIANAWGQNEDGRKKLSMEEWLLDDNPDQRVLIIQNNIEIKTQSKFWIGAFFNYATKFSIGPQRSKHSETPNWFIIDEINSMAKQESITDIINLGREKKSFVFIGCQTISLLYRQYSVEEVETWFNSIGTLWIGKHGRGGGADKAASLAGRRQVEKQDVSYSGLRDGSRNNSSHSYRGEMQQVMLASELSGQLGKQEKPYEHITICVLGFGEKLCVVELPITKARETDHAYIPAPWMKADGFKRVVIPELEEKRKMRALEAKIEKDRERAAKAEANQLAKVKITDSIVAQAAELALATMAKVADDDETDQPTEPTAEEKAEQRKQVIVEHSAARVKPKRKLILKGKSATSVIEDYVRSKQQTNDPGPKNAAKPATSIEADADTGGAESEQQAAKKRKRIVLKRKRKAAD